MRFSVFILAQAFCFLVLQILLSDVLVAEAPNVRVNPLLTHREQIKQLIKECRSMGDSDHCREQIETLEKEERSLRKYCENKPHDFRCDAIKRHKKDFVDPLEELCAVNPHHERCTYRREMKKRLAKRKMAYCKHNPDSSRCRPLPPPKPKEPYLEKHCRTHAQQKRCVKYAAEKRRQTDPNFDKDRESTF
ncbi:MAG TPA: hypothetical protein PKA63_01770 [Oligoflexia bacterium]|nr:hypothetical protein [Oligoflexia bacterium]HMP47378.1 hypothetical protein [Oligoflexia bacterium]